MKPPAVLLLLLSSLASAQTAVDMASEAHHSLLLENHLVRVFELSLQPGERAFARHEHNFLLVTLEDCELVMWPEGKSDIQNFRFRQGDVRFSLGGQAIGLRNDRTTASRNVIVEFLDPKIMSYYYRSDVRGWAYGSGGINSPVDSHASFRNRLRLGGATASDVQLLPGDPLPAPGKPRAELLVPVTEVDLKTGESRRIRKSSGEAVWIPAGRVGDLVNAASQPARFALVEFAADKPPDK
jgi:hypothetical protein